MSNGIINYHEAEIAKYKAQQEEAFHKLSELCEKHGMPFMTIIDELIPLWVDGTHAANWKGWNEYGLYEEKKLQEAVSA